MGSIEGPSCRLWMNQATVVLFFIIQGLIVDVDMTRSYLNGNRGPSDIRFDLEHYRLKYHPHLCRVIFLFYLLEFGKPRRYNVSGHTVTVHQFRRIIRSFLLFFCSFSFFFFFSFLEGGGFKSPDHSQPNMDLFTPRGVNTMPGYSPNSGIRDW